MHVWLLLRQTCSCSRRRALCSSAIVVWKELAALQTGWHGVTTEKRLSGYCSVAVVTYDCHLLGTAAKHSLHFAQEREYELENEHRRLMDKDLQIGAAQRAEEVAIVSLPSDLAWLG